MRGETVQQYLETLFWSETLFTEDGKPLVVDGEEYADGTPIDDLPVFSTTEGYAALENQAREDLDGFQLYCSVNLGFNPFEVFDPTQVAHDFCLSRNGHGTGFFDGEYVHDGMDFADDLQAAAHTFGTHGLMAWTNEAGELVIHSHG